MKEHYYKIKVEWTGNEGQGTTNYKTYNRNHIISGALKGMQIPGSSDPAFSGDKARYNPEDLMVSSISACHMLWYLHLCSENNIVVTHYVDDARGTMEMFPNGAGKFKEVTLYPTVTITDSSMIETAEQLHQKANEMCFIANSCNFKIGHRAKIIVQG